MADDRVRAGTALKHVFDKWAREPHHKIIFDVDVQTAGYIKRLSKVFGVDTDAEVIRKALALARVASEHADSDGIITITGGDKPGVKISIVE